MERFPYDPKDPAAEGSAVAIQWPKDLPIRAQMVIEYFQNAMYLFRYKGKYVLTDESGCLTNYSEGEGPRAVLDSMTEVADWLTDTADMFDKLEEEGQLVPYWDARKAAWNEENTEW